MGLLVKSCPVSSLVLLDLWLGLQTLLHLTLMLRNMLCMGKACPGATVSLAFRALSTSVLRPSPAHPSVRAAIDGGVLNVTLDSPKTRNALSLEVLRALRAEIGRGADDDSVRCVVLRGEGPAFSAGHNLKEMTAEEGAGYHERIFVECNALMRDLVRLPVPVVAAVDGVAAAAGCQLVAICDMAVATEKSTFSTPGSNFGLFCSTPGVPLARAVNRYRFNVFKVL